MYGKTFFTFRTTLIFKHWNSATHLLIPIFILNVSVINGLLAVQLCKPVFLYCTNSVTMILHASESQNPKKYSKPYNSTYIQTSPAPGFSVWYMSLFVCTLSTCKHQGNIHVRKTQIYETWEQYPANQENVQPLTSLLILICHAEEHFMGSRKI